MTDTTFHLIDTATGKFIRLGGVLATTSGYLTLSEDSPVYGTTDIADIHRLMRQTDRNDRSFDLPDADSLEDAFYCVSAVKRYGAVVPGGDTVLLSTELMRVDLAELNTPKLVHSRDFAKTPKLVLRQYIPKAILERLADMEPEFLVVDTRHGPISVSDFVMAHEWRGSRVGEVVHSAPIPDGWPIDVRGMDGEGLYLVLVDFKASDRSYSLSEMSLVEANAPAAPTR